MCCFSIPHTIITDNNMQFTNKGLMDFHQGLHIRHVTRLLEHPQGNGQVEVTNKVIFKELKKRLEEAKRFVA